MESLFSRCPSCGSDQIKFENVVSGGAREFCSVCMFVSNYVEFTCKHCNADVFAICPKSDCPNPGTPKKKICNPNP